MSPSGRTFSPSIFSQARAGTADILHMSNHASALPAPEAGSNNTTSTTPALSLIAPEIPSRHPMDLNREQSARLTLVFALGKQALKPEHAGRLEAFGISSQSMQNLLTLIASTRERAGQAVVDTGSGEAATSTATDKKKVLTRALRQIQAAAKRKYQFTNPEELLGYLVGGRITQSRPILEQSAATIINRANSDRPPGIDTDFIVLTTAKATAYENSKTPQVDKKAAAKGERALRNQAVKLIAHLGKEIQFAADSAWPAGVPENVAFRKCFDLPENRAMSR